jgi:hypothetical protein
MKNVADWKFSAPVVDVDLPRIMKEAETGYKGKAKGVVKVELGNATIVLVDNELRKAKLDLRRPDGYLTTTTGVTRAGFTMGHESPNVYAPSGAVAIYRFATAQEADTFIGKVLDRVEVKVEVF